MRELLAEIQMLKRENEVLRTKNGVILPPEQLEGLKSALKDKSEQLESLEMT